MSLEGSLATVGLPDVLQLLASTAKSGELQVHGRGATGQLWFDAGRLTGFSVGRSSSPVDAVFDLLRVTEGTFAFDAEAERDHFAPRREPVEVQPVLDDARARLEEWRVIEAVVPSLSCIVALADNDRRDAVVLDPHQWSLVLAIGEGRPVHEVLERGHLSEFDGCKAIKSLADVSLAVVAEPADAVEPASEDLASEDLAAAYLAAACLAEEDIAVGDQADPLAAPDPDAEEADPGVFANGSGWSAPRFADDGDGEAEEPAEPDLSVDDLSADGLSVDGLSVDGLSADGGVAGEGQPDEAAVHADGLADRGPWTTGELASLEHPDGEASEEPAEDAPAEEPINRGLLLKFLSSVRS